MVSLEDISIFQPIQYIYPESQYENITAWLLSKVCVCVCGGGGGGGGEEVCSGRSNLPFNTVDPR